MERIDNIFKELVRFAPDANREVEYQEASVPFYKLADVPSIHRMTIDRQAERGKKIRQDFGR